MRRDRTIHTFLLTALVLVVSFAPSSISAIAGDIIEVTGHSFMAAIGEWDDPSIQVDTSSELPHSTVLFAEARGGSNRTAVAWYSPSGDYATDAAFDYDFTWTWGMPGHYAWPWSGGGLSFVATRDAPYSIARVGPVLCYLEVWDVTTEELVYSSSRYNLVTGQLVAGHEYVITISEDGEDGGPAAGSVHLRIGNTITVTREQKTRIPRTKCMYKGNDKHAGWVTAIRGDISYVLNGTTVHHPCWEAQDVLAAGDYTGRYTTYPASTEDPAIHFSAPGLEAYYVHHRIGRKDSANPWDDSKGNPWTSGCIAYNEFAELATYEEADSIGMRIVESYDLGPDDYSISGAVNLTTGPAVGMRMVAKQNGEIVGEATTDSRGIYVIPGLIPGTYVVDPQVPVAYRAKGVRLSPALPWLPTNFVKDHVLKTDASAIPPVPPDCYGVSFVVVLDVAFKVTTIPRPVRAANGDIILDVTATNTGGTNASNVRISTATLGGVATTTSLPTQGQTVAAGASFSSVLAFPGSAGLKGSRKPFAWNIRFDGGTARGSVGVTLP